MEKRLALIHRLFPTGIPSLWCPILTHFSSAHQPDASRIDSHLAHLSHDVRGILVPGSTGEGWEMNDDDIERLLDFVVPLSEKHSMHLLIGVLKTDLDSMRKSIERLAHWLSYRNVVGFTICPPKGKNQTQSQLFNSISQILSLDFPTALYQLPQVTEIELEPETVSQLALEYPNFLLFKDTSGEDRVALSGVDLSGVFMLRGAEAKGYARWHRKADGPYDGFLLSSANVFANPLREMLWKLEHGEVEAAKHLSSQVESVIREMFSLVAGYEHGNPFTNANKALDHLMAYGNRWREFPMPMLYNGTRLPESFVESGYQTTETWNWMPEQGYRRTLDT